MVDKGEQMGAFRIGDVRDQGDSEPQAAIIEEALFFGSHVIGHTDVVHEIEVVDALTWEDAGFVYDDGSINVGQKLAKAADPLTL